MQPLQPMGVRLPNATRQRVAKHATVLRIPQSSFVRVLVGLALDMIEKDPSLLLNRSAPVGTSSE
jgi:hypothetical protein